MQWQRSCCCNWIAHDACINIAIQLQQQVCNTYASNSTKFANSTKTKKPLRNWVAYGCGSWRIRTADPLLVRQMLWTSWAKLPICKAWDCKGSYYFLISKLFISFFKGSCHLLEARPHLTYLWATDFFLLPTSGRHHSSLVCHLSVHPSHLCAWTRTWT